jgi:glycosyltransferase involved in cell wall biosynthesis
MSCTSVTDVERVWVLTTFDISTATGTTEAYYLVRKFADHWDTHVYAPLSEPISGTKQHRLAMTSLTAAILFNTVLIPYFVWQAIRQPPDVVFVYKNIFLPAFIVKLLTGAMIVYDIRADPYQQAKELEVYNPRGRVYHFLLLIACRFHQFSLPRADGVITLSEPLAKRLRENYYVDKSKVGLIPLAVNPDEFIPHSHDDNTIRIGYLGSLKEFRGIDTLVESCGFLQPELQSQIKIDLYGAADKQFVNLIESISPDKITIVWHGYVSHNKIPERVGKCDIAISPLPAFESFELSSPAKIYEYLGLGLPILATDITPHKRILTDQCCVLVPPEDPKAMAGGLDNLIRDDEFRSQLSKNARNVALENTWSDRFDTLCKYLEKWGKERSS